VGVVKMHPDHGSLKNGQGTPVAGGGAHRRHPLRQRRRPRPPPPPLGSGKGVVAARVEEAGATGAGTPEKGCASEPGAEEATGGWLEAAGEQQSASVTRRAKVSATAR
jgi:hypothetical protein